MVWLHEKKTDFLDKILGGYFWWDFSHTYWNQFPTLLETFEMWEAVHQTCSEESVPKICSKSTREGPYAEVRFQ